MFKAIAGSDETALILGNVEVECYVLENGARVISGRGMQKSLGFSSTSSGSALTKLVDSKLTPYISKKSLEAIENPFEFHRIGAGGSAPSTFGYDATILIDIADAFIQARKEGKLTKIQELYADNAEMIIRSVAKVGIIALIDEATGYQYERERFELQKILKAYISEEILKWQLTFTDEFYKEIFRLWEVPFTTNGIKKRPQFIGKLTNKYIYDHLPEGVLMALRKKTPKSESGNYVHRLHQSLSPEVGREHLKKQINEVTALMAVSRNKLEFQELFKRKYDADPQLELEIEFHKNAQGKGSDIVSSNLELLLDDPE